MYKTYGTDTSRIMQRLMMLVMLACLWLGASTKAWATEFEIDLTKENLPTLPTGVTTISYPSNGAAFHDVTHGWSWFAIQFTIDGPVKISLDGCEYIDPKYTAYLTDASGTKIANIDNKTPGCSGKAEYIYQGSETTLQLYCGQYCPKIKVESFTVQQVTVTYYNSDKTTVIGTETVNTGTKLAYLYNRANVTIADGSEFRGWGDQNGIKIAAGTTVLSNIDLYAIVSPIEYATENSVYEYDFRKQSFYPSDHECISITNGQFHDTQHGWYFGKDASITLPVYKNAEITLALCEYSNPNTQPNISVTNTEGDEMFGDFAVVASKDGEEIKLRYKGEASGTLVFHIPGNSYIHYVRVQNWIPFMVDFANRLSSKIDGVMPDGITADAEGNVKIPYGFRLYRAGWTLTGWTNEEQTKVYKLGQTYKFKEQTTLYPVIEKNTVALTDVKAPHTVTWDFDITTPGKKDNAPHMKLEGVDGQFIKQTMIPISETESVPLDLRMYINATDGKFDNRDERVNALTGSNGTQLNDGTILTIPAVPGMKVTLKASTKVDVNTEPYLYKNTTTNFNGAQAAIIKFDKELKQTGTVEDAKTLTYVYNGDKDTLDIIIVKAGSTMTWGFYEYLQVEYPALPDVVLENRIDEASPYPTEKAANVGEVTKSATTHTNTGTRYKVGDNVTVTATAGYGYYISAVKAGESNLSMTKLLPDASSSQPTKVSVSYTVAESNNTVTVEYKHLPLHKITLRHTGDLGKVSMTPVYDNFYDLSEDGKTAISYYTVGTEVTLKSEAKNGYVIEKWTTDEAGSNSVGTDNTYTFTVGAADANYYAWFREGATSSVTFDLTDSGVYDVEGTTNVYNGARSITIPATGQCKSFYIPEYFTFFKPNNTVFTWKDQNEKVYEPGKYYSFATETPLTLKPVFTVNPAGMQNRLDDPVIMWDFTTEKYAQSLNLGANVNTFWTAKVFITALENGKVIPHTRDVAMWVHTGAEGYIKNGDLPGWAAFGPGTTFDVASCAGTTVRIMSYGPITSTTIDGHVPTLDTADPRCNTKNHEYVYKYTVTSSEDRISVVIGDDYGYYKWIEAATLRANLVELHSVIDDDEHGLMLKIEVADPNSSTAKNSKELEDGGMAFSKGELIKGTFGRKFGYELDRLENPNIKLADGSNLTVLKDLGNGVVKMIGKDRIYHEYTDNGHPGRWGGDGNTFDQFTYTVRQPTEEERAKGARTAYTVEYNITENQTLKLCCREVETYYVTYNAGDVAEGAAPNAAWLEPGDSYTIPENHSLYYKGYTLKYWVDEQYDESKAKTDAANTGHVYEIGQTYTMSAQNPVSIRLFPYFEKNTFSVFDLTEDATVKWGFTKNLDAPTIALEQSSGFIVAPLKNGTDWIDLRIELNAEVDAQNHYGKFNNTSMPDRCQINQYSKLLFPATKGCEIELSAHSTISSTNIAGSHSYTNGQVVNTTYNGEEGIKSIDFSNDGSNYNYLQVKYKPQNDFTKPTLTGVTYGGTALDATTLSTLNTSKAVTIQNVAPDVVNDNLPTVVATLSENGSAEYNQADRNDQNAYIFAKTKGGILVETYKIAFELSTPEAPQLVAMRLNGVVVNSGERVTGQQKNGVMELEFDHTMKEATVRPTLSNGHQVSLTAQEGKTLKFYYFGLPAGMPLTVVLESNTVEDVYGVKYAGRLELVIETANETALNNHKVFDFVVGRDGNINDAINAANNDEGTERYYIFVPDGNHQLTGNELCTISGSPYDETGKVRSDLSGKSINNGITKITRKNVSLIGQSMAGTNIYNHSVVEGINYTSTLHIARTAVDFYAEDLTLENKLDYWGCIQGGSNAGRAVVFHDEGNRSVMKKVAMKSWQDTYYSHNEEDEFRGYMENCQLWGAVDWVAGNGNIWFEKCDFVIRERSNNNMAAPSTEPHQRWGYVMNSCNIIPEDDESLRIKAKDWTIARPWNGHHGAATENYSSPAITLLNTEMSVIPKEAGWGNMDTGMKLRFHEYNSHINNGLVTVSLNARSLAACSPGAQSDNCVITATEAAQYNVNYAMVGNDGYVFNPVALVTQIDASTASASEKDANNTEAASLTTQANPWVVNLEIDEEVLHWNAIETALCYFVFRQSGENWVFVANVTQNQFNLTGLQEGNYCVRAANQRGGLGAASEAVNYIPARSQEITVSKVYEENATEVGWSTVCLGYNAKVPTSEITDENKKINVYAAVSIKNNTVTLKKVDFVSANKGYIIYGDPGTYLFRGTSRTALDTPGYNYKHDSYLSGNPSAESEYSASNTNCYTLAYKPNIAGIGLYRFTGANLKCNKAWLDVEVIKQYNESNADENDILSQSSARGLHFVFEDDDVDIIQPVLQQNALPDGIYDMNGNKVSQMLPNHIYIIRKDGKGEKVMNN